MTSHAPAQNPDFDAVAVEAVGKLRDAGPRKPGLLMSPGAVSQELAAALAQFVPADLIAERIRQLIDATIVNRAGDVVPDIRANEAGLKLALAYKVGTPISRIETVNVNLDADSAVGIEERLRNSPALRSMFQKMLDRVDGQTFV